MESNIFGRKRERKILSDIYDSDEPSFIAVYGRRRVGKTFLIKEFFEGRDCDLFHLTGIKGANLETQLTNFSLEFKETFYDENKLDISPKSWVEAFTLLRQKVQKKDPSRKTVLFLDELPWLSSRKSGFLEALDYFWNRYLSGIRNTVLIVCGSAASWMINTIIHCRGGLYGRITQQLALQPFSLADTREFLKKRGVQWSLQQIADFYMTVGGIPKYLSYVKKGTSCAQVINELCFTRGGALVHEFSKLFESLFTNHEVHLKIVQTLAKKKSGLSYGQLSTRSGVATGGRLSRCLDELCASGFVEKINVFGAAQKAYQYILVDEFSLFHLTWMEHLSSTDLDGDMEGYWIKQQKAARWTAWKGYAFERVCLKHIRSIKQALGIGGVITKTMQWAYKTQKSSEDGAEIDIVIERDDGCINLCEVKYVQEEFTVDKAYAKKLMHKRVCFQKATRTKKALFNTLITPHGVKKNPHSLEAVDNEVSLEDLMGL